MIAKRRIVVRTRAVRGEAVRTGMRPEEGIPSSGQYVHRFNKERIRGTMNKDVLQGNWKQFTGSIKEQWGKLTDDDLTQAQGNYDQLVGKIQERYGYDRERAANAVDDWMSSIK
jgi:uncharacterized protein YjbJ (UPF0337 family)